jgi:hypothetical protein
MKWVRVRHVTRHIAKLWNCGWIHHFIVGYCGKAEPMAAASLHFKTCPCHCKRNVTKMQPNQKGYWKWWLTVPIWTFERTSSRKNNTVLIISRPLSIGADSLRSRGWLHDHQQSAQIVQVTLKNIETKTYLALRHILGVTKGNHLCEHSILKYIWKHQDTTYMQCLQRWTFQCPASALAGVELTPLGIWILRRPIFVET